MHLGRELQFLQSIKLTFSDTQNNFISQDLRPQGHNPILNVKIVLNVYILHQNIANNTLLFSNGNFVILDFNSSCLS